MKIIFHIFVQCSLFIAHTFLYQTRERFCIYIIFLKGVQIHPFVCVYCSLYYIKTLSPDNNDNNNNNKMTLLFFRICTAHSRAQQKHILSQHDLAGERARSRSGWALKACARFILCLTKHGIAFHMLTRATYINTFSMCVCVHSYMALNLCRRARLWCCYQIQCIHTHIYTIRLFNKGALVLYMGCINICFCYIHML